MSPTNFVVHMARLDEQLEAARKAGDTRRMQRLIGEQQSLLESMYGRRNVALLRTRDGPCTSPGSPLVRVAFRAIPAFPRLACASGSATSPIVYSRAGLWNREAGCSKARQHESSHRG